MKRTGPATAGLKVEEGTMSQGVQAASGSWKRQGNRFSPELLEGVRPADVLVLAQ